MWHAVCGPVFTSAPLGPRAIEILAEAYELRPDEVIHDVAALLESASSGLDQLVWLRRRHGWHASTCVYYLAALRRSVMGMPPNS